MFTFEKILDPNYKYCRGDPYYRDPRKPTLQEYREYVQLFPTIEDPEIFGMNENANLVFQTKETNFFISTLLVGQPRSSADEGQAQENDLCLEVISKIQEILAESITREDLHPSLVTVIFIIYIHYVQKNKKKLCDIHAFFIYNTID